MALRFQPATFRGHRSRAPSSLACAVRGMTMTTIPPTGHPHLCMGVSAPVPRASFAPNAIAGAATGYDQGNRYLAIVTQVCDSRSFCIPRGPYSVFRVPTRPCSHPPPVFGAGMCPPPVTPAFGACRSGSGCSWGCSRCGFTCGIRSSSGSGPTGAWYAVPFPAKNLNGRHWASAALPPL